MLTEPGQDITWGELHVGTSSMFDAAGFAEVLKTGLLAGGRLWERVAELEPGAPVPPGVIFDRNGR